MQNLTVLEEVVPWFDWLVCCTQKDTHPMKTLPLPFTPLTWRR